MNLIQLPYAPDALAPVISAETLAFHYGKHLQAYVNNLNAALPGSPFEGMSLEEIVCRAEGKLVISQEPNAGNPITRGLRPLLTFDVWEHAYYLDYQNRRPDYLNSLWALIDWDVVEARYAG